MAQAMASARRAPIGLRTFGRWSLTAVVLGEAVRAIFPILFDAREDAGAGVAVSIALAVFGLAPLLASAMRRVLGADRAQTIAVIVLVLGRAAMQLVHPIPVWLVVGTVAVGLAAVALQVTEARGEGRGAAFALALLTGIALDGAIRAAFSTWDAIWQGGVAPWLVGVPIWTVLLLTTIGSRGPRREPVDGPGWGVLLFGPFLFLQLFFLQNAAFVTSEAHVGLAVGAAVVLVGDALGLLAIVAAAGRPASATTRALTAGAAALGTIVLTLVGGRSVIVMLPLTQAGAASLLLFASAAQPRIARPAWRSDLALALGMLLFVGAAFAYMIDIDVPLPVPRAAWPIAAGIVLALAATSSIRPVRLPRSPALVPAIGAVAISGVLLATAPVLASGPGMDPVRLLDWNIHGAVDGDGQVDLAKVAEVIERADPDVVVLQEVGRGWPITGQADDAEWLARRLGMHAAWASAADDQFGNLILSRTPMSAQEMVRLPYGEGPQHRTALRVEVSLEGEHQLAVIGTHLQHGEAASTREQQIEAVLDFWGGDPQAVVAGDLNVQPTEDNVALFEAAGLVSVQDEVGDPAASTARDPLFAGDRVDWIWRAEDVAALELEILDSNASDHLPILATLTPAG